MYVLRQWHSCKINLNRIIFNSWSGFLRSPCSKSCTFRGVLTCITLIIGYVQSWVVAFTLLPVAISENSRSGVQSPSHTKLGTVSANVWPF